MPDADAYQFEAQGTLAVRILARLAVSDQCDLRPRDRFWLAVTVLVHADGSTFGERGVERPTRADWAAHFRVCARAVVLRCPRTWTRDAMTDESNRLTDAQYDEWRKEVRLGSGHGGDLRAAAVARLHGVLGDEFVLPRVPTESLMEGLRQAAEVKAAKGWKGYDLPELHPPGNVRSPDERREWDRQAADDLAADLRDAGLAAATFEGPDGIRWNCVRIVDFLRARRGTEAPNLGPSLDVAVAAAEGGDVALGETVPDLGAVEPAEAVMDAEAVRLAVDLRDEAEARGPATLAELRHALEEGTRKTLATEHGTTPKAMRCASEWVEARLAALRRRVG